MVLVLRQRMFSIRPIITSLNRLSLSNRRSGLDRSARPSIYSIRSLCDCREKRIAVAWLNSPLAGQFDQGDFID